MKKITPLISVDALATRLGEPGIAIVDCRFDLFEPARGARDYAAAHVPGAVYAHLDDDLSAPVTPASGRHPLPEPATFCATLGRLGISRDDLVVAYDGAAGGFAARLWWMLGWLGHDRRLLLDGGFTAWQAAGLPVESGERPVAATHYVGEADPAAVISTVELVRRMQDGASPPLVDAREAARFAGREEPIDDVAGHVPGALNYPLSLNLSPDGRWRSPAELVQTWRGLFPDGAPSEWAVMCGSGVTACHLAVSAACAGLPAPRLYAGSWSEWIRDPERPRAGQAQPRDH